MRDFLLYLISLGDQVDLMSYRRREIPAARSNLIGYTEKFIKGN